MLLQRNHFHALSVLKGHILTEVTVTGMSVNDSGSLEFYHGTQFDSLHWFGLLEEIFI